VGASCFAVCVELKLIAAGRLENIRQAKNGKATSSSRNQMDGDSNVTMVPLVFVGVQALVGAA
jgi:hypothetical protein